MTKLCPPQMTQGGVTNGSEFIPGCGVGSYSSRMETVFMLKKLEQS
jgi:hypothetical protein